MLKWMILTIFMILISVLVLINNKVLGCNEAICGSMVSKCLLTQSCKCDMKNRTCNKVCYNCLGHLYSECCSCVDMCQKPNDTENLLSKKSHVEDFKMYYPDLFMALTESTSPQNQWHSLTFPIDIDTSLYEPKKEIKIQMQTAEQDVINKPKGIFTVNCTVAFWYDCMSWHKCKEQCQSMGAKSFRWFHDGCCECVGPECSFNYGLNESKCKNCPLKDGTLENGIENEEEDEDNLDYGQDDDADI